MKHFYVYFAFIWLVLMGCREILLHYPYYVLSLVRKVRPPKALLQKNETMFTNVWGVAVA